MLRLCSLGLCVPQLHHADLFGGVPYGLFLGPKVCTHSNPNQPTHFYAIFVLCLKKKGGHNHV